MGQMNIFVSWQCRTWVPLFHVSFISDTLIQNHRSAYILIISIVSRSSRSQLSFTMLNKLDLGKMVMYQTITLCLGDQNWWFFKAKNTTSFFKLYHHLGYKQGIWVRLRICLFSAYIVPIQNCLNRFKMVKGGIKPKMKLFSLRSK